MTRMIAGIAFAIALSASAGCSENQSSTPPASSATPQQTAAVATVAATTTTAAANTTATAVDTAGAAASGAPAPAVSADAVAASSGAPAASGAPAVSGAPAASGAPVAGAKTFDCGAKGQKLCPMQGWMKGVMGAASSSGDAEKLASALAICAGKPPPGMGQWAAISNAGAAKAKAGDVEGAKGTCKQCHDLYKEKYKATMRDRPW